MLEGERRISRLLVVALAVAALSACTGSAGEPISMVRSVSEVGAEEVCVEGLGCYPADRFWPGVAEGDCVEVVIVPEQNMPRLERVGCA